MAHPKLDTRLRTSVRAYEKSVVVGGRTLFPLSDPKDIAKVLTAVIWNAEDAAFRMGVEAAQRAMRDALGVA